MNISIVKEIAWRMKDPSHVQKQLFTSSLQMNSTNLSAWASLSHGYPGILLLFSTLDQIYEEEKWDRISHQYVLKIKEVLEESSSTNCSLFGGLAGACFAIQHASKGKSRYQKLLARLNSYLIQNTEKHFLKSLREKIELGIPASPNLYDPISGISGIGIYVLNNIDCPQMSLLLENILDIAISLTRKIDVGPYEVPGWYIPCHYQFMRKDEENYPKGNFNLGISHGISGLLSFLSIVALQGIALKGHIEAIQLLTSWILSKKQKDQKQIYWNDRIAWEEEIEREKRKRPYFTIDAWCYGTAGIARALYLAGEALNDSLIQYTALEAFLSIFSRIEKQPFFPNPTFCHGISGLLTISRLMLRDTKNFQLKEEVVKLENILVNLYNPESPFGFRDREPIIKDKFAFNTKVSITKKRREVDGLEFIEIDKAGILVGASGILLSLLPIFKNKSSWMLPFLIEGDL